MAALHSVHLENRQKIIMSMFNTELKLIVLILNSEFSYEFYYEISNKCHNKKHNGNSMIQC